MEAQPRGHLEQAHERHKGPAVPEKRADGGGMGVFILRSFQGNSSCQRLLKPPATGTC